MTPLTKIENGILSGDWQLVCDGFNKLTGKSLLPPVITPAKPIFDIETAGKKEVYEYIKKNLNPSIGAMKSFSIEELREMFSVFSMENNTDNVEVQPVQPQVQKSALKKSKKIDPHQTGFVDEFRYFQPTKLYGATKMQDVDVAPLRLVEDPNMKYIKDAEDFEYNPREAPKLADIVCLKCKKTFRNLEKLGVELDGETKGICPTCQESVGRQ
jgi:hypothetical protein